MVSVFVCPAAETVLTFGIYKGNTLQFVLENHPAYLNWIMDNAHPTLQKAAKEVVEAGAPLLQARHQHNKRKVEENNKVLVQELFDKRENIVAMFQATVLSVLRPGSVVYTKKIGKAFIVDTVFIPEYNSGRKANPETFKHQDYYNILAEGKELIYNSVKGKWEFGNRFTEVNLTCTVETGSTSDFYILEEIPRYIERVTASHYAEPADGHYNGILYKKGDLIDTATNTVIAKFSHTEHEKGAPCFAGYKITRTFNYKSTSTGKILTEWNLDFGYNPVDFVEIK